MGVDQKRVAIVLVLAIALSVYLLVNSADFGRAGFVFLGLGLVSLFFYGRDML